VSNLVRVLVIGAVHDQHVPAQPAIERQQVDDAGPRFAGGVGNEAVDLGEGIGVVEGLAEERKDQDDEGDPLRATDVSHEL
jgi:hypothetical protein